MLSSTTPTGTPNPRYLQPSWGVAYVSATTSALVTALGLKKFLEKRAGSLLQRYVPFAAVAAANCVNIPLMRQSEIFNGIEVFDENGNHVGESRVISTNYQLVVCTLGR